MTNAANLEHLELIIAMVTALKAKPLTPKERKSLDKCNWFTLCKMYARYFGEPYPGAKK